MALKAPAPPQMPAQPTPAPQLAPANQKPAKKASQATVLGGLAAAANQGKTLLGQ